MKLVADTSVIISVIMEESTKNKLIQHTKGAQLYAPFSLQWEMGNALSAMFKRKAISHTSALQVLDLFNQIAISQVDINLKKAVSLAHKYQIYAYDAYILQCAKEQKADFITLDRQQQNVAKEIGLNIIEVSV